MPNDISDAGLVILEYLWSRNDPARFSEIMEYCNNVKKKDWKKQTVNTFLTRLAQKGFVRVDKNHPRALYSPTLTQEEYHQKQAREIVEQSFHGSIQAFMCAFTGNHKLTQKEKEELLHYIEEL